MSAGQYDPAPVLARQGRRSDRDFADHLGVDRQTIARWRRGTRLFPHSADEVAVALGTHPAALWPEWDGGAIGDGWQDEARCVASDVAFFGEASRDVRAAKEVCRGCPVRLACGDYALVHRIDHGVWGGMSGKERRRVLKMRRLALAEVS